MIWILFALLMVLIAAPIIIERQRAPITRAMRADAPGRFAKLSRGVTHYQWAGPQDGPRVVCIHGLTTPGYIWAAIVKGMTMMGFRVMTYDLYGRGLSAHPEGKQDPLFFRQQLAELLADQEAEDDLILMGYSMGGAIAADFAVTYPEKIQRLMLIAPAGLGQRMNELTRLMIKIPVLGDGLMYALGGFMYGRTARAMAAAKATAPGLKPWPMEENRTRGFLPAVLSSYRHMLSVDQTEIHRILAVQDIPVLAIWGDEDETIPLSAMGKLAEMHRNARQEVIAGADHSVIHTHPRPIMTAIQEFLRNVN